MSLPLPVPNQAYCDVSGLEAGHVQVREDWFITGATPGTVMDIPSLAFLIRHSVNHKMFIFDLGIRRDWENYPPATVKGIRSSFPARVPQDVIQSLALGGTSPNDINTICLSHCHWDHTGDPSLFPHSQFIVGGDCQSLFQPGYPSDPDASFAADLLPMGRTRYILSDEWQPLGPFPRALDFYGDGSLFIIDAPGHLSGNVNLLARTSSDGAWIYLAGDSAHHWKLITGESRIVTGHFCAHKDVPRAEETIERIRELSKVPRLKIVIAHDSTWYNENKGGSAFWPGKMPSL